MLWEMTYALIDEHGFNANLITGNAGNNKSLQLVTDGMKLQPCSPGFVDARDAILAADSRQLRRREPVPDLERVRQARTRLQRHPGLLGQQDRRDPGVRHAGLLQRARPDRHGHPEPGAGRAAAHLQPAPGEHVGRHRQWGQLTSEPGDHVSYVAGSANCGGTYNAGTDTVTFPIGTMAKVLPATASSGCWSRTARTETTAFSDDFEPNLSNWVASHGAGTTMTGR